MMNAQLLQSGLNLANYLQSAFPPDNNKNAGLPGDIAITSQPSNQPPAPIRSLIDAGRFYFRLTHHNVVNNVLCLVAPVGKVRHLVPDLYIPVVAVATFLLLRSVYICTSTVPKPQLNDVLARTVTRICAVYLVELLVLSGLLYATDPAAGAPGAIGQRAGLTDGSNTAGRVTTTPFAGTNPYGFGAPQETPFGGPTNAFNNPYAQQQGPFAGQNAAPTPYGAYGTAGAPNGQMTPGQSQYGGVPGSPSVPMGMMDGAAALNPYGARPQTAAEGATKYFGEHMNMPLSGKQTLHLPEKLFVIGYKYVLLNCYILTIFVAPLKAVVLLSALYLSAASLLFALRTIVSLKMGEERKANPLMFIFPVMQPIFCYILLPRA